jgi:hypothetical protein
MCLSVRGVCPKTSTSLQTALAAEAHLAERQFLLAEDTKHGKVSDMSNRNPKAQNFQRRRAMDKTAINFSKKKSISQLDGNIQEITKT